MRESSFVTLPKLERVDKVKLKPRQTVYFRCDYELFKKLHKLSISKGVSINQLTHIAVEDYVYKHKK